MKQNIENTEIIDSGIDRNLSNLKEFSENTLKIKEMFSLVDDKLSNKLLIGLNNDLLEDESIKNNKQIYNKIKALA